MSTGMSIAEMKLRVAERVSIIAESEGIRIVPTDVGNADRFARALQDGIDQLLDEQEELGGRWKADADRLAGRLNLANAIFGDGSPRWQEANKKALDLHDKEVKSDGWHP